MFASKCRIITQVNAFNEVKVIFQTRLKKQLLIYTRGQIGKNKRFTGTHGEKGWMMGVIQDRWGLAEPADVWSIHGTSGAQHTRSISLDFSFLDFHCSSRTAKLCVPPCGPQISIHNHSYCPLWVTLTYRLFLLNAIYCFFFLRFEYPSLIFHLYFIPTRR